MSNSVEHVAPTSRPRKVRSDSGLALFRPQARIAIAGQGRPLVLAPQSWMWLSLLIGALIVGAGLFIFLVSVPRQEQARGRLLSSIGEVRVVPTQSGIVETLFVRNGDRVQRGDTLAHISTERLDRTGNARSETRRLDLQRQSGWLRNRLVAGETQWTAQQRSIVQDIDAHSRQVDRLLEQMEALARRVLLLKERKDSGSHLVSKGILAVDAQREREMAHVDSQLRSLELKDRLQGELDKGASLETSLAIQGAQHEKNAAELQGQLAALDGELALLLVEGAHSLTAPVTGRVTALDIHVGDAIDPQRPLLVLLPDEGELVAELYLSPKSVGFIEVGQQVQLRLDGFPFQKFGTVTGAIETISLTSLVAREIHFLIGDEPIVYRATVRIATPEGANKKIKLQPGMTLTAQIVLEERPIVEWLFEPLIRAIRSN